MNEIKATAATWQDIKRLSEENERQEKMLREAVILLFGGTQERAEECVAKISSWLNNEQIGGLKDE